jgi:carboxylesterase type B
MAASKIFAALLAVSGTFALTIRNSPNNTAPSAVTRNGTLVGRYEPAYDTDYFLGIPYAQPPVGDLRFRTPRSLNESWTGTRNATEYSPQCIGYGMDTWSQGNYVSKDCLTLNVVRTAGACEGDKLPVLVWFHGGGLVMGGSSDRRYNQSFIVQQATEAGMPILAVSVNYRLSSWGFLYGKEIQEEGNAMNGFRDARLSLQWIQENIHAFGGDPDRVTIQGESAGGEFLIVCVETWSQNTDITAGTIVASQLLAYKGRDDKLFAHAIAESGNPAGLRALPTVEDWEPVIVRISNAVGCANATSAIACLRTVPVEDLNAVLNSTVAQGGGNGFVLDGDFMVNAPATQLDAGDFVHVPYLIGANSDEGTGFGPRQINNTEQFLAYITTSNGVDNATAQDLAILYPDIPNIGIPATLPGRPDASLGLQFKRSSALATDTSQMAPRRFATEMFAKHDVPVYSYRFNVVVNGGSYQYGVPHFQEVAFVFVSLHVVIPLAGHC